MKQILPFVSWGLLAFSIVPLSGFADTFSFTLIPLDGNITGAAGSTVGWGYSITNQSATNWLLTSALSADSFTFGSLALIFDFPVLAPGSTASQGFDAANGTGLYEFTWDSTAPSDYTNYGSFTLSAQWWSGDPFSGGSFIGNAPDSAQTYSATVAENTTAAPEPSTFVLELTVLGLISYKSERVLRQRLGVANKSH